MEQLSCLKGRMSDGMHPYADFAVFGAYGARGARKRKFVAQIFLDGEYVTRQIKGPQTFEAWSSSWRVFRAAMVMLHEASPATLDAYERGIRTMFHIHGASYWPVILSADESMRSEYWKIMKETFDGRPAVAATERYQARPWDVIIAASSFGSSDVELSHWWFINVQAPVSKGPVKALEVVDAVEGVLPTAKAAGQPPKQPPLELPWYQSRNGTGKQEWQQDTSANRDRRQGKGKKGKGKGKGGKGRPSNK
jgi:hypothetical protein